MKRAAPEEFEAEPPLFAKPKGLPFGGAMFDQARDGKRLSSQFTRVRDLMLDGAWRSLREIADAAGYPEASVSARLRDLRKAPFGGYTVEHRRRAGGGTWEYRVT